MSVYTELNGSPAAEINLTDSRDWALSQIVSFTCTPGVRALYFVPQVAETIDFSGFELM